MIHRKLELAFLALLLACPALDAKTRPAHRQPPKVIAGSITREADGDTVFIGEVKVRLRFADAPEVGHRTGEPDQPFGREALDYVRKNWEGKQVIATQHGVSYGRPVVDIVAKDTGANLGLELVQKGLAMCDPRFHAPKSFTDAEKAARDSKRGLFSAADPNDIIPPWDWRKNHRNQKGK